MLTLQDRNLFLLNASNRDIKKYFKLLKRVSAFSVKKIQKICVDVILNFSIPNRGDFFISLGVQKKNIRKSLIIL